MELQVEAADPVEEEVLLEPPVKVEAAGVREGRHGLLAAEVGAGDRLLNIMPIFYCKGKPKHPESDQH